jgi:hypothetical protein
LNAATRHWSNIKGKPERALGTYRPCRSSGKKTQSLQTKSYLRDEIDKQNFGEQANINDHKRQQQGGKAIANRCAAKGRDEKG